MINKILASAADAVSTIHDGAVILCGGFASAGFADELLEALHAQGTVNLILVANNPQVAERGMALLLRDGRVRKLVCSYSRKEGTTLIEDLLDDGMELEIIPQGTLAERVRCAGAGIPGFYTRTGVGTPLAQGKEHRDFDGDTYIMERAIRADLALIKGWKADQAGNIIFRKTARNFNQVMAAAAPICIAEVEEIVPTGTLDPDAVHLPGIYVKRLINGSPYDKRIELRTVRQREGRA